MELAFNRSPLAAETALSWTTRGARWLSEHRIRLSVVVFACLIAEDVVMGINPHDPIDVHDPKSVLALGLVGAGLAIRSWAAGIVRKNSKLATQGPYALVRHPLYVGSFLLMGGYCFLIDDPENIYVVMGPVLIVYLLSVRKEERWLARQFGPAWHAYASRVSPFIPRRLAGDGLASWRAAQWLRNREYQALCGALIGVVAIKIWANI